MRKVLIFVMSLFIGGCALSMFAYALTVSQGSYALVVAAADANAGPGQGSATDEDDSPKSRPDDPHRVISAVDVASADIYLLNSQKAHEYAVPGGQGYEDLLDEWRNYFDERKLEYTEIEDQELTTDLKPGILILPSAVALSPEQRAAIAAFEKNGGSVLATWATGTKNGEGKPTGYDFLKDQFGIRVAGEIKEHDKEEFLVVAGDTPVASTLPAGSRMWLGLNEIHQRPLRISGGDHVAARFMDWDRTANSAVADEAIVYTEVGGSRRVYFGFPESIWQFDQANVYTLVDDVLNWLRRRPHAYLANWPYPYRAAQIVEMDTEQGFPNALNLADQLDSNGFQGTFYCVTSVAKLYPDIVQRLEKKHEIAYHGDVHDAFKGQPRETQSKRLDTMRQELLPLVATPSKRRGFRPPYELADKVVEPLLYEKGFGHILGGGDTDTMLPSLSTESPNDFQKGLIVLPRTQPDDMTFKDDGFGAPEMARAMDDSFDLVSEFGGLGVLSVHTQNFDTGSPLAKAMAQFLAHIKASGNKTWVAPSGTIEEWWRNRALFKASLTGNSKKMVVKVTVEKPGLQGKAALVISNPVRGRAPTLSSEAGMPPAKLEPVDDYQTAIVFNTLKPGSYSYTLTF